MEETRYFKVGEGGVVGDGDLEHLLKQIKRKNHNHRFDTYISESAIIEVTKLEYSDIPENIYEIMVLEYGHAFHDKKVIKDKTIADDGFILYTTDHGLFSNLKNRELLLSEYTLEYWGDTGVY
jgi:hypothetical protein